MPRLIFVNRFFHPDHSATSQILGDLVVTLTRPINSGSLAPRSVAKRGEGRGEGKS